MSSLQSSFATFGADFDSFESLSDSDQNNNFQNVSATSAMSDTNKENNNCKRCQIALAVCCCIVIVLTLAAVIVLKAFEPSTEDFPGPCTTSVPNTVTSELKIISYNTFLRPPLIDDFDASAERGPLIGAKLVEFEADIVTLQEGWHQEGLLSLVTAAQENLPCFKVNLPSTQTVAQVQTGGLAILSRWPILEFRANRYRSCSFPDCLTAKGILMARIAVNGPNGIVNVTVVTTHMNAGVLDQNALAVRVSQLEQLKTFIDTEAEPGSPLILTGDFNVNGVLEKRDNGQYDELVRILDVVRRESSAGDNETTVNCDSSVTCVPDETTEPELLDYIFLRQSETRAEITEMRHFTMETDELGDSANFLSDHRLLMAKIALN